MRIPSVITAGDTPTWTDYPFTDNNGDSVDAGSYTLSYSFRSQAGSPLDLAGTASGTNWEFVIDATQSAALNTGTATVIWYWSAYAAQGSNRLTAGTGTLLVKPNLAALTGTYDGRSQAEQNLAAVEAEITARVSGGATVEYTIGNRSLKKEPIAALLALRSQLRLEVSRERRAQQIANGLGNPQRLGVRFTS